MVLNLSKKDCSIVLSALSNHMAALEELVFFGGEVGSKSEILCDYVSDVHSRIFRVMISAADDEANSLHQIATSTKCTASDVDQRSAGDEVSLDQHVQLYREVF